MIDDRRMTRRQEAEAADWFTLLNDDGREVENEDLERFDKWIQRPGNRAAYRHFEDISERATALRDDPEMRAAAREALTRPKTANKPKPASKPPTLPFIWGGLGLAGVAACAVFVMFALQPKVYQTEVGGRMTAHLDDGSTVLLNTDTRLRVKFTRGERRLELEKGQALFDVAHDETRPFLVRAGPMQVRAIGTRFDVRHDGPGASVTLTQGRVKVRQDDASDASWTLSPGQALALGPGVNSPHPVEVDVASQTGWASGIVTFRSVPLADAVAEMNRYERAKISLAPGVPTQAQISGVFKPGGDEEFVAAAELSFDLESRRKPDGGVELRPRSGG
jgi:transmembrane sensor